MHLLARLLACAVAFPTPQQHPEITPNRAQIGGVSLIVYLAERESYPGLRLARTPAGVELPHNSRQRIILHGRGPRQPLNLNRFLCSVSRSRSRGPALTCDPRVRRTSSSNPRAGINLRPTRDSKASFTYKRQRSRGPALTCDPLVRPTLFVWVAARVSTNLDRH